MTRASTAKPQGHGTTRSRRGKVWQGPDLAPTRWTLIERLQDWGDEASWREFFDTYWELIYSVALRSGLTDTEAQEVVQETVIAVAKKMPTFQCDPQAGSFKGFLFQVTGRRVSDQFRKRAKPASAMAPSEIRSGPIAADDAGDDRTATIDRVPDPTGNPLETIWDAEWHEHLLDMATARLRRRVDPCQYQMFELHVLKGEPVREVARKLAVTGAQVYFAKYRISSLLRREVKVLKGALS